ncbi:SDR family oxidoreductase [bacterium]|nr:SDR family oxidoreductase [bacterium]
MNRYLITGGAGFIGSHVAEECLRRGNYVRVIDNFITGKRENLVSIEDQIDFIQGDIRDFSLCRRVVKDIDFVLHQAALPSVPRSIENPLLSNEINITGTLNLLVASKEEGIDKFVFASSSSVYGDDSSLPKREGVEGNPLSPYALSKLVGEKYSQIFTRIHDVSTVILRYFNIFGPRQDPRSQYAAVIPHFIARMIHGQAPVIFGDGEQSRDFTHVSNVVEANLLAAHSEEISGEIINIGCGERTTVNHLVDQINILLKSDIRPVYDPPRPGDVRHSYADISRANKVIGYKPLVSFRQGLEKTIRWYKQKN